MVGVRKAARARRLIEAWGPTIKQAGADPHLVCMYSGKSKSLTISISVLPLKPVRTFRPDFLVKYIQEGDAALVKMLKAFPKTLPPALVSGADVKVAHSAGEAPLVALTPKALTLGGELMFKVVEPPLGLDSFKSTLNSFFKRWTPWVSIVWQP